MAVPGQSVVRVVLLWSAGRAASSVVVHPASLSGPRPAVYFEDTRRAPTRGGHSRQEPTSRARPPRPAWSSPHDLVRVAPLVLRRASAARAQLRAGDRRATIYRLDAVSDRLDELPFTVKVLLENVLRHSATGAASEADVAALAAWRPGAGGDVEIPFMPGRVLLQDFTGVPAVVDLAAMRDAMAELGGDPARINPLVPASLVIDHSVQVDRFGSSGAFAFNVEREYERNGERYQLLRWAQTALRGFRVVPPGTGIVHQVNLEHLGEVVSLRADETAARGRSRPWPSRTPSWAPIPTPP